MAAALQPNTPAITPEALNLIKAGTPVPQNPNPLLTSAAIPTAGNQEAAAKSAAESAPVQKSKIQQKETTPETITLVSVNYRLPAAIPTALLKASSDRKLRKTKPYTQQDIVGEALAEWLKKHGYLN
jgi:hypothetical protein